MGRNVLLVPLITSNLSIAHYGEWEMLVTAIAFLTPWLTLGLASALIRFLPGTPLEEIREGFYSIFFFVLGCCLLIAGILFSFNGLFDYSTALASLQRNIPVVVVVLLSTILLGLIQTYYRAFRRMLVHSSLMLSQHFVEAVLLFYLIQGGSTLSSALWVLGATRTVLMIVGLGGIVKEIGIIWPRFDRIRTYLSYSIPLMPNALFYRLYDSSDRFLIYTFIGSTAVGKYAAIYLAGSLFTTILSPIHTVLLPTMAELWNKGRHSEITPYIEQIVRFSALVTIPALLAVAIFSDQLLSFLIQHHASTEAENYLLICISFAVFGLAIPCGDLLAVAGKTRLLFILNGGLASVNVLLNLILIPYWGILGAVLSTLSCHTLFAVVTYFCAQSVVPLTFPKAAIIRCVGSSIIASIILFTTKKMGMEYYYSIPIFLAVYSGLAFTTKAFHKTDLSILYSFIKPKSRS